MESKTQQIKNNASKVIKENLTEPGREGDLTRRIEEQTERIPSGTFLAAGIGAMGASLVLKAFGMHKTANFVGLWTPTILTLGLYNKLVKLEGHESPEKHKSRSQRSDAPPSEYRYN